MEKFRNFDKKYIKRVLLNKDADDYLSLRLQEITIDEHYARLYMPAMIMHEKLQVDLIRFSTFLINVSVACRGARAACPCACDDKLIKQISIWQQHDSARSAGEVPPTYSASEQQMLRLALSNTPFEVFRHKAFARDDSEENVAKQLRREHEDRMTQVHSILYFIWKSKSLTKITTLIRSRGSCSSPGRRSRRYTGRRKREILRRSSSQRAMVRRTRSTVNGG